MLNRKLDSTDYFEDNDFSLLKTAQDKNFLDESEVTITNEDDTQYAVIVNGIGKYACSTSNDANLNAILLLAEQDKLPEDMLKMAASNLRDMVSNEDLRTELEKVSSDTYSSNIITIDENELERINEEFDYEDTEFLIKEANLFPVSTPEEIIKSAEYFDSQFVNMEDEVRKEVAEGILKVAHETKTSIPMSNSLLFYTGHFKLASDIKDQLMYRATFAENNDDRESLQKIANEIYNYDGDPSTLLLEVIEFEKEAGINDYYEYELDHPIQTLIEVPDVTFAERIENSDKEAIKDALGEDTFDKIASDNGEEIYNELPAPMKEIINQYF